MSSERLLLALALALAAYVLPSGWTRSRRLLGIAAGKVVSANDSLIRAPTVRSERQGLVGRCDHLMRVGMSHVPVKQKPTARRLEQSHNLRVGAPRLLAQDVYGVRPPYGIVASSTPGRAGRIVLHYAFSVGERITGPVDNGLQPRAVSAAQRDQRAPTGSTVRATSSSLALTR